MKHGKTACENPAVAKQTNSWSMQPISFLSICSVKPNRFSLAHQKDNSHGALRPSVFWLELRRCYSTCVYALSREYRTLQDAVSSRLAARTQAVRDGSPAGPTSQVGLAMGSREVPCGSGGGAALVSGSLWALRLK